MTINTLEITLLLLACSVFGVVIFRSLQLPPILGYLTVGIVIGPHSLGWVATSSEAVKYLAEFGVVFLMFSIGLEFNLNKLKAMKKLVFGLGVSQVMLTMLLTWPVSLAFKFFFSLSWQGALALGGVLAMSSTAIVTKMLAERLELETPHGRNVIGILLFQDLAVVPLLIIVPALGQTPSDLALMLLYTTIKIVIALMLIFFIGSKIMSKWLHIVVTRRSQELFMLNLLLITLGMAALTEFLGLSLALGAFLAGILISETSYHHQVEDDIKPFRDVLLGLFFITIGMSLDLHTVFSHALWVFLLLLVPVCFKLLLITGLTRIFGSHSGTAIRTGLILSTAGEFGFVLLNQISNLNLIEPKLVQIILAAMILSMLLAPFLIEYSEKIALRFASHTSRQKTLSVQAALDLQSLQNKHAIICGFGHCGQILAHMLEKENRPYIALDLDPDHIREATLAGQAVIYGDATRKSALLAAGIERASVVIITHTHTRNAIKTLHHIRALAQDVPVIVRTVDDADITELRQAGATEIVPELIEGGMILASHALVLMGIPMQKVAQHIQHTRNERYAMLRGYFHGADETLPSGAKKGEHIYLQTLQLPENAKALKKKVSDLDLARLQVSITAIQRLGRRKTKTLDQISLQPGDVLVLSGTLEALDLARLVLSEVEHLN